jgi:phosphoribosyl-ATP pyrophosphohydrolase
MAKPTKKARPSPEPARGEKRGRVKTRAAKRRLAKPAASAVPAGAALPTALALAIGASDAALDQLWSLVMSRRDADPKLSHSARLLSRGTVKIAQKFGEEAVECLIEAILGEHRALVAESADVLYHLIVLWVDAGVRPEEVWAELRRREGVSAIAEKAARVRTLPLGLAVRSTKIP